MEHPLLSWKTISSERIADCKVFSVTHIRSRWVSGGQKDVHNFYLLHPCNWVNVIPVTQDRKVVMVEQFRHGIETVTLEIPGGSVDPEDASWQAAAARELLEETGFVSDDWVRVGFNHPNPALQSNICETYLARNVRQIQQPRFDESSSERISLRLVPLDDIPELIRSGTISHALVIVAFYLLQLHDDGKELFAY
ncbi:MAG TPA: NUDIX hydrolase [Candidatus Obscuribacterales bacterium]